MGDLGRNSSKILQGAYCSNTNTKGLRGVLAKSGYIWTVGFWFRVYSGDATSDYRQFIGLSSNGTSNYLVLESQPQTFSGYPVRLLIYHGGDKCITSYHLSPGQWVYVEYYAHGDTGGSDSHIRTWRWGDSISNGYENGVFSETTSATFIPSTGLKYLSVGHIHSGGKVAPTPFAMGNLKIWPNRKLTKYESLREAFSFNPQIGPAYHFPLDQSYRNNASEFSLGIKPLTLTGVSTDISFFPGTTPEIYTGRKIETPGYWYLRSLNPVVTGTATTSTPVAGTVTVAGQAPTLNIVLSVSVSPTAGDVTVSGQTPTVGVGAVVEEQALPVAGAVTVAGQTPTVSLLLEQTMSPVSGEVAVSGQTPTVSLLLEQTMAPASGEVTVSGDAPTLGTVLSDEVQSLPVSGEVTVTGDAPTLGLLLRESLSPSSGLITLTGQTPTVTAADTEQTLAPTAGAVTIAGQTPVVNLRLEIAVSPALATVTLSGQTPTVTAVGGAQTLAPAAGLVSIVGNQPALGLRVPLTPSTSTVTLTGQTPTITARTTGYWVDDDAASAVWADAAGSSGLWEQTAGSSGTWTDV